MFDLSFGEIFVISVVALVVLGPERLPEVARTLGALLGRLRRFIAQVKIDIGQEAHLSSLSALKQEMSDTAQTLKNQFETGLQQAQLETQAIIKPLEKEISHTVYQDECDPSHDITMQTEKIAHKRDPA